MAQDETDKPLEQTTDPLPTQGNTPQVVDAGRQKRLANLTRKGRGKAVSRKASTLSRNERKQILMQLAEQVPQTAIAAQFGISDSAVAAIRDEFGVIFRTLKDVDKYRKVKAELFDAVELQTLKSLSNSEKHERASLNQVAYTMQVLHNAGRLEKNQSTANVNVNGYLRFGGGGKDGAE